MNTACRCELAKVAAWGQTPVNTVNGVVGYVKVVELIDLLWDNIKDFLVFLTVVRQVVFSFCGSSCSQCNFL